MTKIVALLSWYDERPEDLTAMVDGLARAPITHLVALDGAYRLYPGGKPHSPTSNYTALETACRTHGIGLSIHTPDTTWHGNETQKRTTLFHLGETHTTERDWFLIIDGDEVILNAPNDLTLQLAATPLDVAEVTFIEPNLQGKLDTFPIPILFRAIRGIQVVGNHYTYKTPDGRNLWGNAQRTRLAARHPLPQLTVLHTTSLRAAQRKQAARTYYRTRDAKQTERGTCDRCPKPATRTLHTNWRPGHDGYVADWAEACTTHALEIEAENRDTLATYGLNPDSVHIEHRLGPAPA